MQNSTKQPDTAKLCVIWMHGLGSNGADMKGLAESLSIPRDEVEHIFLEAPIRAVTLNAGMSMPAWYDITGLNLEDREDKDGIIESATYIQSVIEIQLKRDYKPEQIILAGFSQGGAMSLYSAITSQCALGGVIALSAYLPLSESIVCRLPASTPFFIGFGTQDDVVQPAWSEKTIEYLKYFQYQNITCKTYPIGHSVSMDELSDISAWINDRSGVNA